MPQFDLTTVVGLIVVLLLALSWHEAAHAWVADRLGDPTARLLGRVTLNPLKHLDPFLSFALPALMFYFTGIAIGGGKPVPINVANFRHRARDFMLVALAGPFSNLLLGAVFAALFVISVWTGLLPGPQIGDRTYPPTFLSGIGEYWSPAEVWLKVGVLLNLLLALFNLMPIPPLDGSRVIGWLLPRRLQFRWYALDRLGFLMILLVLFGFDGIRYVESAVRLTFDKVGLAIDQVIRLVPMT